MAAISYTRPFVAFTMTNNRVRITLIRRRVARLITLLCITPLCCPTNVPSIGARTTFISIENMLFSMFSWPQFILFRDIVNVFKCRPTCYLLMSLSVKLAPTKFNIFELLAFPTIFIIDVRSNKFYAIRAMVNINIFWKGLSSPVTAAILIFSESRKLLNITMHAGLFYLRLRFISNSTGYLEWISRSKDLSHMGYQSLNKKRRKIKISWNVAHGEGSGCRDRMMDDRDDNCYSLKRVQI